MMQRVSVYMSLLNVTHAALSDTLIMDPDNALNTVIHNFISRNFIELADEDEEEITDQTNFIVKHNKRAILDYYKNSVITFFIPAAYTATAILEADRFKFALSDLVLRFTFLRKLFRDEFSYDEQKTPEEEISACIKAFINEGILVPDSTRPDMLNLTSQGLRKLKWLAAFLLPFFESYKTTLLYLEKEKSGPYDARERAKKILAFGGKLYKRKNITLKESLSLINYKNAVNYFTRNGINGSQDQIHINQYRQTLDRLAGLILS
jgi:glycerol-3-phosphate O-acyltransferase